MSDTASAETSFNEGSTTRHTCDVDVVSKKEQSLEDTVTSPAEPLDDFPEGGLRAWLVVFGVSAIIAFSVGPILMSCRRFATHFQRESYACLFASIK
jgi:hypothetical protein